VQHFRAIKPGQGHIEARFGDLQCTLAVEAAARN
jgi:hypothetical protein